MLKSTTRPLSEAYQLALLDLDGVVYRGKNLKSRAPRFQRCPSRYGAGKHISGCIKRKDYA